MASGNFGASLMRHPGPHATHACTLAKSVQPEVYHTVVCANSATERVHELVAAMRSAVRIPVTVKHRLGVDEMNQHSDLAHFVDVVARAPADRLIVHARQALLHGISPKDNRTVPPLNHQAVFALKAARPALAIELNGGVGSLEEAEALLACGASFMMYMSLKDSRLRNLLVLPWDSA